MRSIVLAAALLCAQPALAQDPPAAVSAEDQAAVRKVALMLDAELAKLAAAVGVEAPAISPMTTRLAIALFEGMPVPVDYGFSIGFRFRREVVRGEALDPALPTVFADAQACADANPHLAVVRFERLDRDAVTGHRCVLSGPSDETPGSHVLAAVTVMQDEARHLENRVAAVAGSEAPGRGAQVIAARTEALVAFVEDLDRMTADLVFAAE